MNGDNWKSGSYAQLMAEHTPYITITLDLQDPVDIEDFVGFFGAVSSQFDRHVRSQFPDVGKEARFFVKEVRHGSIIADMFPGGPSDIIQMMDNVVIVTGFASVVAGAMKRYIGGGRVDGATKSDLKDYLNTVRAVARDKNGSATIETAVYRNGVWHKEVSFTFTTKQAREASRSIERHKEEMDKTERADHERVLMYFKRTDKDDAKVGKRSSDRVIIESISDKDLSLIYASNLAEEKIKDVFRHSKENLFKLGFVVDVNVETKRGRPVAYAVTNLHSIIDLPED